MNFHEPRVGTGTTGPGEAVFAIRFDGKPVLFRKIRKNYQKYGIRKISKQQTCV